MAKLTRFIKKMLPRTLLGRSLLILILPLFFVQIISSYVFFERHWDGVTRQMARTLASDISMLIELDKTGSSKEKIESIAQNHLEIFVSSTPCKKEKSHQAYLTTNHDSILSLALHGSFWESYLSEAFFRQLPYNFHVQVKKNDIIVTVYTEEKEFSFQAPRRRVFTGATLIFILWSMGTSILFLLISTVFMKNQIRPIKQLALAAEQFGKRLNVVPFKPSGAIEVRKAGIAFSMMRERILRQIKERTEMLAGVSHDLRTPLTRIHLQLALSSPIDVIKDKIRLDLKEMEDMIQAYLSFARGDTFEKLEIVPMSELILDAAKKASSTEQITYFFPKDTITLSVRPKNFQRALINILSNAHRYGGHIWTSLSTSETSIRIIIEDNGPGIPKDKMKDVFRPFFRLDHSRNKETGGVGLGLSISRDIIRQHGGTISLDTSIHGGLKVIITLPK